MARTENTTLFMQQAYPGYAGIVERGIRKDPAFRDLCEDFERCALALEAARQRNDDDREARINEYEQLLGELAQDVEAWLGAMSGSNDAPGEPESQ